MNSFLNIFLIRFNLKLNLEEIFLLEIKKKNIEEKYGLFIVKNNSKSLLIECF